MPTILLVTVRSDPSTAPLLVAEGCGYPAVSSAPGTRPFPLPVVSLCLCWLKMLLTPVIRCQRILCRWDLADQGG